MEWMHTLTIIGTFFGMFLYMLLRQDKLNDQMIKNDEKFAEAMRRNEQKIIESIHESKTRIALIEGYLWKRLNEEK